MHRDVKQANSWLLCCAIQREYNDCSDGIYREQANIFNVKNMHFYRFVSALDSKMADLQSEGVGINVKQADPINEDDKNRLWESGTVGLGSALGLSNGVYLYNNICFGLRASDEHRHLSPEQYEFVNEDGKEKLLFHGRLSKSNQGLNTGRWYRK